MRVEFYRSDAPDTVVGMVTWTGSSVRVDTADDLLRDQLVRAFRPTPVEMDDVSRPRRGVAVVQPGSLEWFRAVTQGRATADTGLAARFVPGIVEGGYDPAAQYRSFRDSMERLSDHAD
ncbi:MAG: hypothetical protein ABJC60_05030 [Actinomycetota bacterium]